ncbi:hypothetical protein AXF42_Ash006492 [Apostasia shenzhenica]|uniref:Uncharacterized protein n=1 Tax=Apostasia shenzhenica TaxID=1088818 RepID=A0A2I0AZ81_9ASPA|nr:hypothetical protein AXF42_Ash006492 [Apostasia shenzhenica]
MEDRARARGQVGDMGQVLVAEEGKVEAAAAAAAAAKEEEAVAVRGTGQALGLVVGPDMVVTASPVCWSVSTPPPRIPLGGVPCSSAARRVRKDRFDTIFNPIGGEQKLKNQKTRAPGGDPKATPVKLPIGFCSSLHLLQSQRAVMASLSSIRPSGGVGPFRSRHACRSRLFTPPIAAVFSASKARFVARRSESSTVQQLQRPLAEYMALPASQYSVLDAQRIERVDSNTFRCYVYRMKFFSFEVCPVLVVRVEEEPCGCCIRLLSSSMVNKISYNAALQNSDWQQLITDTFIEVAIEVPFLFRAIPVATIESTGTQVLEQLLRIMLPRFLDQLAKDYQAWASGDNSRKPLGTGEI